ncbi:MAG: type II toxin-antitoxin system HicA family toxin [Burkholderiales bacterium]
MPYNEAMQIKKTKELIKLVESFGYSLARQAGSHMIFTCPNRKNAVIPNNREIARGTLRQILNCVYDGVK